MPGIDLEFLKDLQADFKNYPNFIETGTCMGSTILHMEKYFSNLYTIEIKKEFYENIKSQYRGNKINFYIGDSGDVLSDILPAITGKSIIFLDKTYKTQGEFELFVKKVIYDDIGICNDVKNKHPSHYITLIEILKRHPDFFSKTQNPSYIN